jgi:2-methylcitrate dehydratase PrpD
MTSEARKLSLAVGVVSTRAPIAGVCHDFSMLTAYIAGYEVWAELLAREPTPLHRKGWHPTTVLGTIAAAAACAKLCGLDATGTS